MISQFNKYYPILEKNVRNLLARNKRLKVYSFIFIAVIILLVGYIIGSLLNKGTRYQAGASFYEGEAVVPR